jgi:hypothetical protein
MKVSRIMLGGAAALLSSSLLAGNPPDFGTLAQSSYFISVSGGSASYQTSKNWKDVNSMMKDVTVFDRMVGDIEEVLCGTDQNKSVLVVGEPSDTYRYVFSRLATKVAANGCQGLTHTEVDVNKIEAGHSYVGEVEEYWANNVLRPSDNKDVVLYFSSLSHLMGVGSHSNDTDGIEKEYASNFTGGRIRTVAYMDKYEYDFYVKSRLGYVLNSFARKVTIESLKTEDVDQLAQAYLRVLSPGYQLGSDMASYLYRNAAYYQPNVSEPQRSLTVLKSLIRSAGPLSQETREREVNFESAHPYVASTTLSQQFNEPGALSMQLAFESFKTFDSYDKVTISNALGMPVDTFYGDKGAFTTTAYPTDTLTVKFISNDKDESDGFKISKLIFKKSVPHKFDRNEVRRAVMEVAQVPRWLIDRDFNVVKQLRSKLDADVVGCKESKDDIERLAKAGYVGGRTDDKPIGSVMLVGPTGTGKSFIAKTMSTAMDMKLVTIDMTSYKTPESFDRFMDIMATNLTLYPYAIYLFEEIDKADPLILDRLYFMVDEGVFYDKFQRPLFARGSFVMMTTNAAEDVLLNSNSTDASVRPKVNEALRKMFRASFLNRFDAISLFFPFSDSEYDQLAKVLIDKKIKKMKENFEWNVSVDQQSRRYVSINGRSPRFGARPMERLVENVITAGVAEFQLQLHNIDFGDQIDITKMPTGPNTFHIQSGQDGLNYEVVPQINDGSKSNYERGSIGRQLEAIFSADRMYDDR